MEEEEKQMEEEDEDSFVCFTFFYSEFVIVMVIFIYPSKSQREAICVLGPSDNCGNPWKYSNVNWNDRPEDLSQPLDITDASNYTIDVNPYLSSTTNNNASTPKNDLVTSRSSTGSTKSESVKDSSTSSVVIFIFL